MDKLKTSIYIGRLRSGGDGDHHWTWVYRVGLIQYIKSYAQVGHKSKLVCCDGADHIVFQTQTSC